MSTPVLISYVNQSALVKDADVSAAVVVFGAQLSEDFAPYWGYAPAVEFVPDGQKRSGNVMAFLKDQLDVPNALGYHDVDLDGSVTGVVGMPFIMVWAAAVGYDWRTTASHENLEASADYSANLYADSADGTHSVAYGEVADPDENIPYVKGGMPMSNFVTRAWFDPEAQAGERLDFMGRIGKPQTIAPGGGYMIVRTEPSQVTQVTGSYQDSGHDVVLAVHADESKHHKSVLLVFSGNYPSNKKPGKIEKAKLRHMKQYAGRRTA